MPDEAQVLQHDRGACAWRVRAEWMDQMNCVVGACERRPSPGRATRGHPLPISGEGEKRIGWTASVAPYLAWIASATSLR